jgi:short-subunit dehydrogenase
MKTKDVIICGTTGKLGLTLLIKLLNDNYRVVGLNKSRNKLKDNNYFEYICDFRNLKKLKITINKIKKKFKNIKLFINTAAIEGNNINFPNDNISSWKETFDINFFSNIILINSLLKNIKKKKLSVILFSGGGATIYPEGIMNRLEEYSCSKIALIKYTEILASKIYLKNIVNFNILAPGPLPGNIIQNIIKKFNKYILQGDHKLFNKLKKPYLFEEEYEKIYRCIKFLEKEKKISGKIISTTHDIISSNNQALYKKDKYTLRRLV